MLRRISNCFVITVLAISTTACDRYTELDTQSIEPIVQSTIEAHISVESNLQEINDHFPVTIRNYNFARESIEMTFYRAPERVLAVYQNSVETLLALGLEDKILAAAGLDHDVKLEFAEAFANVNLLDVFAPDRETVIMMQPDFIVSWHSYFNENNLGEVDYWHVNNINTYIKVNSGAVIEGTLENEFQDIINMGKIFNVIDRAEAIVDEIRLEIEQTLQAMDELSYRQRVIIMESRNDNIFIYGENSLAGDMVRALGAELITAEGANITAEGLIALNPDIIFTVYFGSGTDIATANLATNLINDDPRFASLDAVINNRVYAIPLGEIYCSGIRTIDGIRRLAAGIIAE